MLPEDEIGSKDSDEVSLVCLVSSSELQDSYIAWSEDEGQNTGVFADGITFPPQKTNNGYSVANVYTTTKKVWEQDKIFYCNVWVSGLGRSLKHKGVSKKTGNSVEC